MMKKSMLQLAMALPATLMLLCTQNSAAQNVYKWVDAKGSTHYSANPPPKAAKKKGKVETYGWKNSAPTPSSTHKTEAPESAETERQNTPAPASQNAAPAAAASAREASAQ